MPSERFFYRPVDPNYGAIGRGIANGLGAGVENYYGEKENTRQRGREDDADAARRRTEAAWLNSQGGGFGEIPEPDRPELDFGLPGIARREPGTGAGAALTGKVTPGDLGANPDWMPPNVGPVRSGAEAGIPRTFVDIGEPGREAYIEDFDSRTARLNEQDFSDWRRQSEAEFEIEERYRQMEEARIGAGLGVLHPDDPGSRTGAAAALIGSGAANYGDVYPEASGRRDQSLLTPGQYLSMIEESTIFVDEDNQEVELMDAQERYELSQRMARGDPTARIPTRQELISRQRSEFIDGLTPQVEAMFGNTDPFRKTDAPTLPASPVDPEYVKQLVEALQAYPKDEWLTILQASGADPALIERILGR